MYGLEIIACWS